VSASALPLDHQQELDTDVQRIIDIEIFRTLKKREMKDGKDKMERLHTKVPSLYVVTMNLD